MKVQALKVELGDCTLYHGDCLEVMKDFPDNSVDVVIVDPPYGIDYQSAWRTDKTQWKSKIKNDKTPFLGWSKDIGRITKIAIYVFYRWDKQKDFYYELMSAGFAIKSQ